MNTTRIASYEAAVPLNEKLESTRASVTSAHKETRAGLNEILQPEALREYYETFEDFHKSYKQVMTTVSGLLSLHPAEIANIQKIIDEAILLYPHPDQYHNAIHMLTTLTFALDRAIAVNQLLPSLPDIVTRTRNVTTMVAYHDTGNKDAPRPNAADEMEASDNLLAAIDNASDDHPLHIYATEEGREDRNIIIGAILGSFFRERFVWAKGIKDELANPESVKYAYVTKMAQKLEMSTDELAVLIADNKYSKLMRNADPFSSLVSKPLYNLIHNYGEDIRREAPIFIGQDCKEYDGGFKTFLSAGFSGTTDDPTAVALAKKSIPVLVAENINTNIERDEKNLQLSQEYLDGIFHRHAPFINLLFALLNRETMKKAHGQLLKKPFAEVLSDLKEMQANPEEIKQMFLRKKDREESAAEVRAQKIAAMDFSPYEQRMLSADFGTKTLAQLTEKDICTLLGEDTIKPYEFMTIA